MEMERRPLDVQDYLAILRRRKWLLVLPTLLVAGATLLIAKNLPNLYRSETLILIEGQRIPESYVMPTVRVALSVRLQTMTQEILSRTRLQAIIEKMGLYQDQADKTVDVLVARMRKDVEIEMLRGQGGRRGITGFKIYYQAPIPEVAQNVLREITSLFINENLRAREQQAVGTTEFLSEQLARALQRLQKQEQQLREFKIRYFSELPQDQQTNLALLSHTHIQLQANSSTLDRNHRDKAYLEESLLAAQEANRQALSVGDPDRFVQRVEALRTRLLDLQARYQPNHPDIVLTKDEIEMMEQVRAESEQEKKGDGTDDVPERQNPGEVRIRSRLQALQVAMEQTLQEREEIQNRIRALQRRVTITPLREQQLTDLTRDYVVAQKQYDSLLGKILESQVATDLERRQQGERFRILDPPTLPTAPYKPDRLRLSLMGLVGGLGLAVALVVGVEIKDESLRTERDISYYINLPTLACVPRVRGINGRRRRVTTKQHTGTILDTARH